MGVLSYGEILFLGVGLLRTIGLSLMAMAGGFVAGFCAAVALDIKNRWLNRLIEGYFFIFQGTPLLMQLFILYYGFSNIGLKMPAWLAIGLAFTLHAGAFLGQIWRGALLEVPKGQKEAAEALGLRGVARLRLVVLPQAARIALPSTIGFCSQLIKSTSVASIVGYVDLTFAGNMVSNATFKPIAVFGVVAAMYFAICWPVALIGEAAERRLARHLLVPLHPKELRT